MSQIKKLSQDTLHRLETRDPTLSKQFCYSVNKKNSAGNVRQTQALGRAASAPTVAVGQRERAKERERDTSKQ